MNDSEVKLMLPAPVSRHGNGRDGDDEGDEGDSQTITLGPIS